MFETLLTIVAPVLICTAIGFFWVKGGRLYHVDMVTTLITSIGAPCLVFYALSGLKVQPMAFATMAAATVATIVVTGAVAATVLRSFRWSMRSYLPALTFANIGNMGLPLCYLAFGDKGLALALAVFAVHIVFMFTAGIAIASGRFLFRDLVRMPILYAVGFAVPFLVTGVEPPRWVSETTKLLGGMTIPMMLITLGVSLAQLRIDRMGRSVILGVLRLALGCCASLLVASALELDPVARGVLVVQSTMPSAVFNYLFAERYGTAPSDVAGVIVTSTCVSFLTLPLLLWLIIH